ncbi:MAG: peptide chain release factor N(5)-glutamine methyltransferase [Gammaproteobacteria bacterium]|nr:peptide chain release factor N(5)-glutamine methyltransferase [Gammaproteobacteria bacterium]
MINHLNIKTLRREIAIRLENATETPQLDAEILLMHALNKPRSFLYAHGEDSLSSEILIALDQLVSKRLEGTPIAYLLGEREFWSLLFYVTSDTLIPRPETERLVELSLELFSDRNACSVLELGTGTGAISIALATEKPHWNFLALDQSKAALHIAEKNITRHHLSNIKILHSNWFEKLDNTQFDLIISNPPYLAVDDPHQHQGDLRFEPKTALLSGKNGLEDLNILIQSSMNYLRPGGLLLLEHGYEQASAVRQNLTSASYQKITCWQDENHLDRVSSAWKPL